MNFPRPRRKFLKTFTMAGISAGVALFGVSRAFGQKLRPRLDDDSPRPHGNMNPKPVEEPRDVDTVPAQQISIQTQQDPLFFFTQSTFEPYVGDIFQAPNAWGRMITLTLIRVEGYQMKANTRLSTKKTAQPKSFSLTFRAEARLPQFTSIHKISHPALGNFDLFLTGRQADDGTLLYEAVFNHLQ